MRRPSKRELRPIRHGAEWLCAILLTTMPWASSLAQEGDPQEVEEAPPPPLPAVNPAPPAAPSETAPEAPPAVAPGPASEEEPATPPEELVVTGSRLRRADLNTPAPVTTLDRQKIEQAGRASIGEILQSLPSQSNAINVQFNNGGNGATRINLRGLDVERTLVLLNGRRFVAGGDGADAAVDLNAIPLSIIERIEVLKDGASAVYGSDAIGGVVNIITRRDFSGVETSLYTGAGQHGGLIYQISATAGEVTDKAGILFSFEYFNQGELFADKRGFSNPDSDFAFQTFERTSLGSTAPPQGYIGDQGEGGGNAAWQTLVDAVPSGGDLIFYNDPTTGWRPFRNTGTSDIGEGDQYNYQPENYLLTPQERYNIFALGHYSILPKVRGYFEGSYTNRRSDQLLAPTPLFTISEGITVSGQNIYNPFERDFVDVRRRMVEASNRRFFQDIDTYRAVLGLDGGLPEGLGRFSEWNWDAHFVYGRTEGTNINEGRFVLSRVVNALGPSFVDDSGVATCGTRDNPIAGCVPLDLFGGAGSITPEMLNYISYDGTARGFSEQQIFGFDINGPVFSILDRDVGLALGYQHRREEGGFLPDPLTAAGDTTGNKQESTQGDYNVNAAYAELALPIVLDLPGIEIIELSAAGRWVDFSSFGSELTWKFGARWQLLEHVALRGTASRSFRAPSVDELFAGQEDDFPTDTDPCDESGTLDAVTRANCLEDGIITADPNDRPFTDTRTQLRARVGGNPDLDAESAETFTGGIVITPRFGKWSEGLSLTVDYWTIKIENSIQQVGSGVLLANCYSRTDRQNCGLIQRDPNTNLITNIIDIETNIGSAETAGVDFGLVYRIPTDFGRFGITFDATYLQKYDETQADGTVIEGAGVYDLAENKDGGVFARFRFNSSFLYNIANFGAGLNVNYVGPFRECDANDCQVDNPFFRNVESWASVDIFASYRISSPLGLTSLAGGINNVGDTEPPFIDNVNSTGMNSDSSSYDYLGRYFYFRLSQTF